MRASPAIFSLICAAEFIVCPAAPAQYVVPSPLPSGPLVYNGPNGPVPIPALYEAVLRNDRQKVESLLQNGADANEMCPCGTSPLEAAVQQVKNAEIAELLLSHGADANARTPKNAHGTTNDWTPLFYAVYDKRSDLVALLLKHQAKVDVTDIQGASPLYWAKKRHSPEIVKQLKDAGATDNISDSDLKPMTPPPSWTEVTIPADKLDAVATSHSTPEYSLEARRRRLAGRGVFELTISEDTGDVKSVTIAESTGYPILDRAAVRALKLWRFRPHTLSRVKVPLTFSIPKKSDGAKQKT